MSPTHFLLLHGALATETEMLPLKERLLEKGHMVHTLTFSGHGENAKLSEFRIEIFAQDIENFIEQKHLTNVHLFGYSMGGYAALYYQAHSENPQTSAITTYGTKFDWSPESVKKEIPKLDPKMIASKAPPFREKLIELHGEHWEKILSNTAHMMEHLEKLDGLTKIDLESISIPVVLMLGENDKMVTTAETEMIANQLPKATMLHVPASPHDFAKADLNFIVNFLCHKH